MDFNYDLIGSDDNIMTKKEQVWLHTSLFDNNFNNPNSSEKIQVWIVPDISTGNFEGYGRATKIGYPITVSLIEESIVSSHPTYRWRTLANEIGHAVFSLHHPDNDSEALDPIQTGGVNLNSNEKYDEYNFMNSGPLFDEFPV